jgi:hypothetical protein
MQDVRDKHRKQRTHSNVFFTSFEELKNIDNRVAWFLAELCKAERCAKRQAKPALDRAPWGGWGFIIKIL